jgi:oligopeptide transport system substrate-binding protein
LRLLCLFAATLFGPACSKQTPASTSASGAPQILRVGQRNEPADLDPARITLPDEFAIVRALLEGLLIPGATPGADPLPGAAARYAVSVDGLAYTFHLRPDARWSDGSPLTAADFVASFRRALTPATAAPKANVFFGVTGARAFAAGGLADFAAVGIRSPDTHTLVVTLEQPNPRFPHYVASGPWLPVHLPTVEQHGRKWTAPEHFVGNGPFVLAEWRAQQHLVLRRNPRWHSAASVRLAELHFVRLDSGDTEERAYRAGQIEVTMGVPQTKIDVYARERPADLHRVPMLETRYLSFNTRRPPLDNPAFRRALSLALDRQRIVDRVTRGGQPVAATFVPPALSAAPVASSPPAAARPESFHRFDPAAARVALDSAGLARTALPRLELTAWSPSQVPVLEAIQAMWRETLGLETAIAIRDAKVHLDALATGNYDIGFITAIPDVADAANLLADFVTGAPENYPQLRDAAFDTAFTAALAVADPAARATALAAAERRLLETGALAPIYFNTKVWLMSPRVRGWHEDGLWSRTWHTLSLDDK